MSEPAINSLLGKLNSLDLNEAEARLLHAALVNGVQDSEVDGFSNEQVFPNLVIDAPRLRSLGAIESFDCTTLNIKAKLPGLPGPS
jgi:hypothetical protein